MQQDDSISHAEPHGSAAGGEESKEEDGFEDEDKDVHALTLTARKQERQRKSPATMLLSRANGGQNDFG